MEGEDTEVGYRGGGEDGEKRNIEVGEGGEESGGGRRGHRGDVGGGGGREIKMGMRKKGERGGEMKEHDSGCRFARSMYFDVSLCHFRQFLQLLHLILTHLGQEGKSGALTPLKKASMSSRHV